MFPVRHDQDQGQVAVRPCRRVSFGEETGDVSVAEFRPGSCACARLARAQSEHARTPITTGNEITSEECRVGLGFAGDVPGYGIMPTRMCERSGFTIPTPF